MNEETDKHYLLLSKLKEPFAGTDLEWKIQTCGTKADKTPWALVVAYVTARAIMERLEDVVGPFGWVTQYREVRLENGTAHAGIECALSVRVNGEWITRRDICEPTDVEPLKGAYSGALKRAAVQFGIGRYLYLLEDGFAEIADKGQFKGKTKDGVVFRWNPPPLPNWALPGTGKHSTPPQGSTPPPQQDTPKKEPVAPPPPKSAQAKETAPAQNVPVEEGWRYVTIPPFIKKYAGMTLGELPEKDIIWWAENYEPKPFRGVIQPKDVLFKKALKQAAAFYAGNGEGSQADAPSQEPAGAAAGTSAEIDDDIPF